MLAFRDISRTQHSVASGAKRTFSEFAVLGAYPGRLFTAPYVLSIRYLAALHDTAMIWVLTPKQLISYQIQAIFGEGPTVRRRVI